MTRSKTWIAVLAAAGCLACSPVLDWREFVPEGTDLGVSFPCRPDRHARAVLVAGAKVQMDMLVCGAGGATFALGFFDVDDPARIAPSLAELRATAIGNVRGRDAQAAPLQIKGMTPNEQAVRLSVQGALPDGAAVQAHAAFFTRGLRIYQATVIGAKPTAQAIDTFFGGLKFAN